MGAVELLSEYNVGAWMLLECAYVGAGELLE